MSWQIDAAIVVAGLALLGTIVNIVAQRRKTAADTAEAITRAAGELVGNLQSRVEQQQKRIQELERVEHDNARRIDELTRLGEAQQREIVDMRAGIRLLCRQIEDLGGRPVWAPMRDNRNAAAPFPQSQE